MISTLSPDALDVSNGMIVQRQDGNSLLNPVTENSDWHFPFDNIFLGNNRDAHHAIADLDPVNPVDVHSHHNTAPTAGRYSEHPGSLFPPAEGRKRGRCMICTPFGTAIDSQKHGKSAVYHRVHLVP